MFFSLAVPSLFPTEYLTVPMTWIHKKPGFDSETLDSDHETTEIESGVLNVPPGTHLEVSAAPPADGIGKLVGGAPKPPTVLSFSKIYIHNTFRPSISDLSSKAPTSKDGEPAFCA